MRRKQHEVLEAGVGNIKELLHQEEKSERHVEGREAPEVGKGHNIRCP